MGIQNQKWKRRQEEDQEIGKILEMMEHDTWSTYKYTRLADEDMK